ncbi:MAG: glycosyl hydrolase family 28 protein [Bacteroidota bacterium]|nr:glycosyl hydrolase family 28 protein [Bacteroidota bacterium]
MNFLKIIVLSVFLGIASLVKASDAVFDITKYGAVGDSKVLNTIAIQKAIDDCSQNGGGKVVFPKGNYLSGTIVLKDNVVLKLEKEATIFGSINLADYRNLDPFTEGLGIEVGWALVVAVDAKNVGIEGEGTIDGQGAKIKAQLDLTDTRSESKKWGRRPFLIRIVRCDGISVKGVTLKFAGAWTSHYYHSKSVQIENVKIESYGVSHNDGIDIDACQDVSIKNCDINSGDDGLCFKTTSSQMACKNIVVSGLKIKSRQAAIKTGTESMAAFENIKISGCYIYDTNNGGIKLNTVDGAHLRNIEISDITMVNVRTPMLFRLGSRLSVFRKDQDTQQQTGTFENVVIRNVKAQASANAQLKPPSGILITGVPGHYISNLTLENIEISLVGKGSADNARHEVPEAIDKYPEVSTFGPVIPAYGVWARHVSGLKLKNVNFTLDSTDLRPAFIVQDGKNVEISNGKISSKSGGQAVIRLEDVAGARISNMNALVDNAEAFLRIEGKGSSGINVHGCSLSGIRRRVDLSSEVNIDSLKDKEHE